MENQIVVFELNSESFGIDIAAVESIIKMQEITAMPQAPDFVEGVINLRGKVLPVIDLRKRFNLSERKIEKDSRIIVVNTGQTGVGMIVDGVSEVLTISDGLIEEAPKITSTVDSTFVSGIAKVDNRLIILLDLGRVLSQQEQDSLARAAAMR